MRFHVRRLALLALSATGVAVVVLNVLRPYDVDLSVPPPHVDVRQRLVRPVSLDQRLARYGSNSTNSDPPPFRPDPEPVSRRPRATTPRRESKPEVEEAADVGLMSEGVSGSRNERVRRQYVRLPERSGGGARSLWWSESDESPDDRILAQMRHVPRKYRRDEAEVRTIYMPGGLGNEPEGQEKFIVEDCPVNNCRLTSDRSAARTAEMRLLQADALFYHAKKPPQQVRSYAAFH